MPSALDLIGDVVRGSACDWPGDPDHDLEAAVLDAVTTHSVEALVYWRLRAAGTLDRWPASVGGLLARVARDEAVLEAARQRPLRELLSTLDRAGVPAVLFKGAALAYTRYAQPWLRPRNDADLLVRQADREQARAVLLDLGYEAGDVLKGDIAGHQAPFTLVDRMGLRHAIDLHWKISNRPLLADMLTFDEMWAASIGVPPLGPAARAAGDAHALLLACVHPVVHHRNGDNLLWWHDVHLLASQMPAGELERFVEIAAASRVAAICASSLDRTTRHFRTTVPEHVRRRLADAQGEDSARYLRADAWRGDVRLADFRSLAGWRARLQLIREVAFPDAAYMLKVYGRSSRLWVPALHVHRLVRGTWRLLGRWHRGGQVPDDRFSPSHERSR